VELLTRTSAEIPADAFGAFKDRLFNELVRHSLSNVFLEGVKIFATPRRLAVSIPEVEAVGQDRETEMDVPRSAHRLRRLPVREEIRCCARKSGRKKTPRQVVMARVKIKGLLLDQILSALVADR